MTINQELQLSYYQTVADINTEHNIYLVQDIRTKSFYVKKVLSFYNAEIYRYIYEHPIPNTPKIILLQEEGSTLIVIEEYIPGETLEQIIERNGPFSLKDSIKIVLDLCIILRDFHNCTPAIVNRDINPSNIKISPDGVVKLIDINTAKWNNPTASKDTVLLGTQGYAAPEQYGFGASGIQTDVYSVGVLLNMLLTGAFPSEKMYSGNLGMVIKKCLSLSPAERYENIVSLSNAIKEAVGLPNQINEWRSFLPPGFRSGNFPKALLAIIGYAFISFLSLSLIVENAGFAETLINRITAFLALISVVLFSFNYLNIQPKFGVKKDWPIHIRFITIVAIDIVIFIAWIILMLLLLSLVSPT